MAKFKFEFQSVLAIKEKLEEQKKLELGNLISLLEQEVAFLQELIQKKSKYLNEFYSQNGKSLSSTEWTRMNDSVRFYSQELAIQNEKINKIKVQIENKRQELKEVLLERKAYDLLKEKAYEAYLQQERLEEEKSVDEVISYKYINR